MRKALTCCLALLLLCGCAANHVAEQPVESMAPSPVPSAAPEPVATEPPLPEPPELDIRSWEFLYAGSEQGVGRYHPQMYHWENQYMDLRCGEETRAFIEAARDEGFDAWIGVGYRNWEYSLFWYERAIEQYGNSFEAAKHGFAAGCSEHRTGLAFDVTDELRYAANYYEEHDETVADTELYKWMAEHCAEYGFIVRYPEGHEQHYGRACYPGHFRYVGVEAAEYIMENGICFEEFLELYE